MPGTALRASKSEIYDRLEKIADMLGSQTPEWLIREKVRELWGTQRRQTTALIARARGILIARTQRPREEHQVDSYSLYRHIIQNSPDAVARIRAQERIDSILGLDARYTGGPLAPLESETVLEITINVAGLSVDEIEQRVERGDRIDPKSIEHLPRADYLRIVRKATISCRMRDGKQRSDAT